MADRGNGEGGGEEERGAEHFVVTVVELIVLPHPNADALELAQVGEYFSAIKKGLFRSGQKALYVPEDALIPSHLAEEWAAKGFLPPTAAKEGKEFRVRPIKLRGVLSQGVIAEAQDEWELGKDVKELLGIAKWEPPQRDLKAAGRYHPTFNAGSQRCLSYDIENFKWFPRVLEEGEECVFSEKIHGTWCQIAVMPKALEDPQNGRVIVASKGLASKGVAFKYVWNEEAPNMYIRAAMHFKVPEAIEAYFAKEIQEQGHPVYVLGEVFGAGVQDLTYGGNFQYRIFDVRVGRPGTGSFLGHEELERFCAASGLPRAPVLYRGPFSHKKMEELTNGRETLSGKALHLREGIVIRPVVERRDPKLGRVQLKSISEKYLLRANGTEFR